MLVGWRVANTTQEQLQLQTLCREDGDADGDDDYDDAVCKKMKCLQLVCSSGG